MDMLHGAEARDRIWSLIKDIKVAMLATWDHDTHEAHARPMMALDTDAFDGTLWFFTARDSRKAQEVGEAHAALLTYAEPKAQKFVSVSGRGTLVDDRNRIAELWTDYAKVWFPGGVDDPNLVLLRFEADTAEFWEAPNALARGISYVGAIMTGETPDIGRSGTADIRH